MELRIDHIDIYQIAEHEYTLHEADHDGQVPGIFGNFLPSAGAFFLQLLQAGYHTGEQLRNGKGRPGN